jgi:hypothetical protein
VREIFLLFPACHAGGEKAFALRRIGAWESDTRELGAQRKSRRKRLMERKCVA